LRDERKGRGAVAPYKTFAARAKGEGSRETMPLGKNRFRFLPDNLLDSLSL
jgi:hypothetical protein